MCVLFTQILSDSHNCVLQLKKKRHPLLYSPRKCVSVRPPITVVGAAEQARVVQYGDLLKFIYIIQLWLMSDTNFGYYVSPTRGAGIAQSV